MIRLTEINKTNEYIECRAFVEDCSEPFVIRIDKNGDAVGDCIPPTDYGWCDEHIGQAIQYMKSLWKDAIVPTSKLIMWY